MKKRREANLASFRRRLRKAPSANAVLEVGWQALPKRAKAHAAASLNLSSESADALDDPFVHALWTAVFNRGYSGEQVAALFSEAFARVQPIKGDIGMADPTLELGYLRSVLKRSRPAQAELNAAVVCTLVLCRNLITAPAEYLTAFLAEFDRQRAAAAEEAVRTRSSKGGRKSGLMRAKQRNATVERAAKTWLRLEADPHLPGVTLQRLADASGIPLNRLQNLGSKLIRERADQLRSSHSVLAPKPSPKSRDK